MILHHFTERDLMQFIVTEGLVPNYNNWHIQGELVMPHFPVTWLTKSSRIIRRTYVKYASRSKSNCRRTDTGFSIG